MKPNKPAAGLFVSLALCVISLSSLARAADQPAAKPYEPTIAPASEEGQRAIRSFQIPAGLKVEMFAAEPLLANPVAFCVDEKNRFYVVETFRLHSGVTDTRGHMNWLDDDLACRTVDDRVAMYRKYLGSQLASYATEHDRVRLLEDTDGDGRADKASVFAEGFNDLATGLGAGVLARKGDVWFTCIPSLWLLKDTNGDGRAEVKKPVYSGFGVHVGFLGHDLHGLRIGPDGKLYFSVGDRGLKVQAGDRHLFWPDTGCVLRCNLDGSDLEVFASGLRNPQELVFDEYGNLFTADNNSDSGDKARWVYLVEGGDSGWRIGYQFIQSPNSRGPWNSEKLWYPAFDGQSASIVPPIANLADGPSGLTYDPGSGLSDKYRHHFFLADFRGAASQSGIRTFAVKEKGASFELIDEEKFVWGAEVTDVDFGMDGSLYFTDWVEGWNKTGKGRIYSVTDPATANDPVLQEVKGLFAAGFEQRRSTELAKLLEHGDQRVRQEAQFALSAKGDEGYRRFVEIALEHPLSIARLHAIWGMGQMAAQQRRPELVAPLVKLLQDRDLHIRQQAAKVLGEARFQPALKPLIEALRDDSLRVRFFAAMALAKLGKSEATAPIIDMLRENADRDPYLRHAGVMALKSVGTSDALLTAANDPSASVRLGALLALRRLENPEVSRFLNDADARVVLEAARAINDQPMPAALPALAALADRKDLPDALARRVLNANFRLGGVEHARALVQLASREELPDAVRAEALEALGQWAKPRGVDRVMGLWRPIAARPATEAVEALRPVLATLAKTGSDRVRQAMIAAAAALEIKEVTPLLREVVADASAFSSVRVEALKALDRLDDGDLGPIIDRAVADTSASVRAQALRMMASRKPAEAAKLLAKTLESPTLTERQQGFAILGELRDPSADEILAAWLDRLSAGQVAPEVQLDLLEAASQRDSAAIKERLAKHEAARSASDPLAAYREVLAGGDSRRGRQIFNEKEEVSCQRCHKVRGRGGEVGPDLTGIGSRQTREYLLEAIVAPNQRIAEGFETLVVATKDGQILTGVLKKDDGSKLHLLTAEAVPITIDKSTIEEQTRGASAMPADVVKSLSKRELRDLVEFLATMRDRRPTPPSTEAP